MFSNIKLCFFDLETTGLNTSTSSIIQLGACDSTGSKIFVKYVQPSNGESIKNAHIHGISDETLKEKKAETTIKVLKQFEAWIMETFESNDIYLIAHNCFNYDFLILEMEYKRVKRLIPSGWKFLDSLDQFRKYNPEIGYGNYNLSKLFKSITGKELENAHSALVDSQALAFIYNILTNDKFTKELYTSMISRNYHIPTTCSDFDNLSINKLNGVYDIIYKVLSKKGYTKFGQLLEIFKKLDYSTTEMNGFLECKGVTSASIRRRILTHLDHVSTILDSKDETNSSHA